MEKAVFTQFLETPIGGLRIVCTDVGLQQIQFVKAPRGAGKAGDHPLLKRVERQLLEYFSKKRKSFHIPLDMQGTDFQKKAWQALLEIPYGERRSYAEQAKFMGKTTHYSRAVGGANNKNPIPIVIPCHRVVGSNQSLVGYAGGLKIKEYLLNLES